MIKTITIQPMSCAHCAHTITQALERLDGVTVTKADPETKTVSITDFSNHSIKDFQNVLHGTVYQVINVQ